MTLKQAAKQAIEVQNARNMAGVAASFLQIVKNELMPVGGGTDWVNAHPICTLFISKMQQLNGYDNSLSERFEAALKAVEAIANEEKAEEKA